MDFVLRALHLMSVMEWLAFFTGVICVYLYVIERDASWPIGVVNSAALLYVFWQSKLYAQTALQIFYIVECFYGWWVWTRRDRVTGFKLISIGRMRSSTSFYCVAIGIVGTAARPHGRSRAVLG